MSEELTNEEEAADRAAIKRFQERLAQDFRAAEERGRVETRMEWRGYLRKSIARERLLRAELYTLRTALESVIYICELRAMPPSEIYKTLIEIAQTALAPTEAQAGGE